MKISFLRVIRVAASPVRDGRCFPRVVSATASARGGTKKLNRFWRANVTWIRMTEACA